MLTDKDITKISQKIATDLQKDLNLIRSEMATKKDLENFATKKDLQFAVYTLREEIGELREDMDGLRENVQALTVVVDSLVKTVKVLVDEYSLVNEKLRRHEKWIQEIAGKVGVKLDYR